jgi:hypothetical protein
MADGDDGPRDEGRSERASDRVGRMGDLFVEFDLQS